MRVAAAWSVDPAGLDGQRATGCLTLARLPTSTRERRAAGVLLRSAVPFDVNDVIISGRSIEDVNTEIARRIRQQSIWRQRVIGRWRHHRR